MARCPAHDDRQPSLSLSEGFDGRALLCCHAGCSLDSILEALGLEAADLFVQDLPSRSFGKIVDAYDYRSVEGNLQFQVVRLAPKSFRQRQPDGSGWIWNRKGVAPILYRLPEVNSAIEAQEIVWIVEGEKDADNLVRLGLTATTAPGGAGKWASTYSESLTGARAVILPDNDEAGRDYACQIAESLEQASVEVSITELPGLSEKCDVSDWIETQRSDGLSREEIVDQLLDLVDWDYDRGSGVALAIGDFLSLEIPPRRYIIDSLLAEKNLALVHSWRGVGKTNLAISLACCAATGADFLGRSVPNPVGVLYVDGEMPASVLQERFASVLAGLEVEGEPRLRVISADRLETGIPPLVQREGQRLVENELDDVDLLILDNLSCLFGIGNENDAEGWAPAQEWLLSLRRRGIAVVLIHHSGKGGQQRGTSKREDAMDLVLNLRLPRSHKPSDGCRFELHFEKHRGLYGRSLDPFEARLLTDAQGRSTWGVKSLGDDKKAQVLDFWNSGVTNQRELASELGCSASTVNRKLQELRAEGAIQDG